MKKWIALLLLAVFLFAAATGCASDDADPDDDSAEDASEPATEASAVVPEKPPKFDPYATENNYVLKESLEEEQEDTDYGTIDENVRYYSRAANDYKYCNVLLPPGYDKNKKYPVLYLLHGWMSGYDVHLCPDSYLQILYGNMLREKRTVPMIIVSAEMYTDELKKRAQMEKNDEQLLAAYNKILYDLPNHLMLFIERKYPVRTDRKGTAIMGVSQGGTKTLAIGFSHLDRFGYIGSFAPDPGSIPTNFLKGTIWNAPLIEGFPDYDPATAPYFVYLAVGADDPENVEVTKYYGKVLTKMGYKNQTDVVDGFEHDYIFWRVCFYNFMNKIFRP